MTLITIDKEKLFRTGRLLALFALLGLTSAPMPALAFGGDEPAPKPKSCPKGKIWSKTKKKCVWKNSSLLNDEDRYDYGYRLASHGQYAKAIVVLNSVADMNDPRVLTYIGYSHRKMGRFSTGVTYYRRAIAIDPDYVRAREYLGEGYVAMGDLRRAKLELGEIEKRCGANCPEYRELLAAIDGRAKKKGW